VEDVSDGSIQGVAVLFVENGVTYPAITPGLQDAGGATVKEAWVEISGYGWQKGKTLGRGGNEKYVQPYLGIQ
jgi:hypothetical protein